MRKTSRAARCAAVGLALGVLALGCSDDEPTVPEDTPPASESQSAAAGDPSPSAGGTGSDGPTATADPTESAEPSATPAAGLLLQEEISQVNVPAGEWERLPELVRYASAAGYGPTTEVISLSDRENFASPASLDEQVKFHNRTLPEGAIVKRQPDVLLDGELAYYVQWYEKGDTKIQHDIGLDYQGRVIAIQMDLNRDDPAATEAMVASVLASFTWR